MERFVGFGNFEFLFRRETFWMVVKQSCIFAVTAVVFKALWFCHRPFRPQ
jgi:multiple sugar transport system permease protein